MSPQQHRLLTDVIEIQCFAGSDIPRINIHSLRFELMSHYASEGMGVVFLGILGFLELHYSLLDMLMQQNYHETFERRRTMAT